MWVIFILISCLNFVKIKKKPVTIIYVSYVYFWFVFLTNLGHTQRCVKIIQLVAIQCLEFEFQIPLFLYKWIFVSMFSHNIVNKILIRVPFSRLTWNKLVCCDCKRCFTESWRLNRNKSNFSQKGQE